MVSIDRTRLITRISDPNYPVVALIGPRGYGKSTILTSLAQRERTLLLRLPEGDLDPRSLAARIRTLLATLPEREDVSRLDYELSKNHSSSAATGIAVATDLAQHQPLTLLIDGVELLGPEGRGFLLQHVLKVLPPGIRVVLAMTDERNLAVATLQLTTSVLILGAADMEVTGENMRALGLTPEIADLTGGWPAAVALAAANIDPQAAAEELLSMLPTDLLPDLRRASLLDTWVLGDPLHAALGLNDGWLSRAREWGLPMSIVGGVAHPHPMVHQHLRQALIQRPTEHQAALRALGQSLRQTSPLNSARAFLDGGAIEDAERTLTALLADEVDPQTLAAILPLLRALPMHAGSPLALPRAQAMFDSGEITEGLRAATECLTNRSNARAARRVLGGMLVRCGRLDDARVHLEQAIRDAPNSPEAAHLTAELTLSLAAAVRAGDHRHAAQCEQLAMALVEQGEQVPELTLVSRTARAVVKAALRQRAQSRMLLELACDYAARENSVLSAYASIMLSGLQADEGEFDAARELLQLAEQYGGGTASIYPWLTYTRARIEARSGNLDGAASLAAVAARESAATTNELLRREALILHAVCCCVIGPEAAALALDLLRTTYGHERACGDAALALEQAFVHGRAPSPRPNLPAEAALVLSLRGLGGPEHDLCVSTIREYRHKLGHAALGTYAAALRVNLPDDLRYSLVAHLELLRANPLFILDGRPLMDVTDGDTLHSFGPRARLLLLALSKHRVVQFKDAHMYFHMSPAALGQVASRLRALLRIVSPGVTMSGKGAIEADGWSWSTDIDLLRDCPNRKLTAIYRSPVMPGVQDPIVLEYRQAARAILCERLTSWAATDPAGARAAFETLRRADPELAWRPVSEALSPAR